MVAAGKPVEQAKDELYAEVVANFDQFLADRQAGQPFLFWFGPTNVHRKWVRGSGLKLWGIEPDRLQAFGRPFSSLRPRSFKGRPCCARCARCRRLYDGYTLRCKYKGHTNRNTQVRRCGSCLHLRQGGPLQRGHAGTRVQ